MEKDRAAPLKAHPRYEYNGLDLSTYYHPRERVDAVYAYTDWRDTDVVLQTYAKSGTHLGMDLYLSILKEAEIIAEKDMHFTPLEIESPPEKQRLQQDPNRGTLADLIELKEPRLVVTHLPISHLPNGIKEKKLKVIHVRRNPKDVFISKFHFEKKMGGLAQDLAFNDFLDKQIDPTSLEGRQYFQNLRSWYSCRDDPNVLSLQYEEIIKDIPAAVRQIAEFVAVTLTDKQVEIIAAKNKFETRQAEATGFEKLFLRQGTKGGWKSVLTVAQNERFDQWIAEGMKGMDDLQIQYE